MASPIAHTEIKLISPLFWHKYYASPITAVTSRLPAVVLPTSTSLRHLFHPSRRLWSMILPATSRERKLFHNGVLQLESCCQHTGKADCHWQPQAECTQCSTRKLAAKLVVCMSRTGETQDTWHGSTNSGMRNGYLTSTLVPLSQ
jgi:hypothetical protein